MAPPSALTLFTLVSPSEHTGSDQYKKYNCLILIDNSSVYHLSPALEEAFCYQKRPCKKCRLSRYDVFRREKPTLILKTGRYCIFHG